MEQDGSPTRTIASERPVPLSALRRRLYLAIGLVLTLCGLVGIVTPVLPTTGFLIAASFFFARSSPRMHAWLLRNKLFGPYIKAYADKVGLSIRRKLGAIAFLWAGIGASMIAVRERGWLLAVLASIAAAVTAHIALIRSARPPRAETPSTGSFPVSNVRIAKEIQHE